MKCPVKNSDWIRLVEEVGELNAYKYFMLNNEETPTKEQVDKIIENRQPSIAKLLKYYNADTAGFLPKQVIVEKVKQDIKNKNLDVELKQASNGRYYLAKNGRKVTFYDLDGDSSKDEQLSQKLQDILTNIGIKIEAYDSLINRLGVDAAGAADIMNNIIYIANNKASETTLPEEVSHFFIRGLGLDNPLVKRLMDNIDQHPIYQQVLNDYTDLNYTQEELKEEAVGKLLGKYIVQEHKSTKGGVSIWEKFKGTMNLLLDKVYNLFKKITNQEMYATVEQVYGKFAKDILKGDIIVKDNNDGFFYQMSRTILSQQQMVEDKLKAIEARIKDYKAREGEYGGAKEKIEKFIKDTEKATNEIKELNEVNHEAAYLKLLELVNEAIKDTKERITTGELTELGLSRAINYMISYKNINLVDTTNEVIKKSANELEGQRLRLQTELEELAKVKLGKIALEETSSNRTVDKLLTPTSDLSWDQQNLGAMANADDSILAILDKKYKREVEDKVFEKMLIFDEKLAELLDKVNKEDLKLFIDTQDGVNRITSKWDASYYKAKKQFIESIDNLPHDIRILEWRKWFNENHTVRDANGKSHPKDRWISDKWKRIQVDPNIKALYDFVMSNKIFSDRLMGLEVYTNSEYRLPQFHKTLVEQIASQGKWEFLKGKTKKLLTSLEYTKDKNIYTDETDKPISFLKKPGTYKLEDPSTDIVNVLKAYVYSAEMYRAKRDIQGLVELTKTYVALRKVPVVNRKGAVLNQDGTPITMEGLSTRAYKRVEDWIEMIYFGNNQKDQGSFNIFGKQVDKQKVARALGKYNSVTALALNLFSATSNIIYGGVMQVMEAVGGEYYTGKDYAWATKTYATQALSPKLRELVKYFKVVQDTSEYGEKHNWISKLMFGGQTIGEDMLQVRMFLAMAHNYKVELNGEKINLWDAFEYDGKLKLKEGMELTNQDISDFRGKVRAVNQKLHGRYDTLDQAALQQYWWGYLALQFRKWMHPGFEARFRSQYYDERLNQYVKGRYLTYVDFFKAIKELKGVVLAWNSLDAHGKANMRRNIMGLFYTVGTFLLLSLFRSMADDDDELDNSKGFNFFLYQIDRFQSEMKFYNVGILTGDLTKLLRSPAAAITTLENVGRIFKDAITYDFLDEEENLVRGEDYTKLNRDFEKLIPILKEAKRWKNVEDQSQYFKTF